METLRTHHDAQRGAHYTSKLHQYSCCQLVWKAAPGIGCRRKLWAVPHSCDASQIDRPRLQGLQVLGCNACGTASPFMWMLHCNVQCSWVPFSLGPGVACIGMLHALWFATVPVSDPTPERDLNLLLPAWLACISPNLPALFKLASLLYCSADCSTDCSALQGLLIPASLATPTTSTGVRTALWHTCSC